MCLVRTPGGPDAPAEDAFGLGFFVGALAQGHSRPRPEAGVGMMIQGKHSRTRSGWPTGVEIINGIAHMNN